MRSWKNSFLTPPASMPSSPMKCTRSGLSRSRARCRAISLSASCKHAVTACAPGQLQEALVMSQCRWGHNACHDPTLQSGSPVQGCGSWESPREDRPQPAVWIPIVPAEAALELLYDPNPDVALPSVRKD